MKLSQTQFIPYFANNTDSVSGKRKTDKIKKMSSKFDEMVGKK